MGFNPFLDIVRVIIINIGLRPEDPEIGQDFRNHSANWRLFEHCHWPVILLDNELDALLHFGQHGMKIAGHLGLAQVDACHSSHHVPSFEFVSAKPLSQTSMSISLETIPNLAELECAA